jgi:hypothetical protein
VPCGFRTVLHFAQPIRNRLSECVPLDRHKLRSGFIGT